MGGLSDYAENQLLDHLISLGDNVSLHTGDPGETGANELSGGSYARFSGTFNAAAGGEKDNSALLEFPGLPAATITHAGVWDAVSAGNFLIGGPLNQAETVGAGHKFEIPVGDLTLTMD